MEPGDDLDLAIQAALSWLIALFYFMAVLIWLHSKGG